MRMLAPHDRSLPGDAPSAAPAQAFAAVAVHADPAAVDAAWAELESLAPCSIYQTRRFLLPWIATLGAQAGILPFLVLANDGAGRPAALLPLGISRRGMVRIAGWLGGRDSNLPMALLRHPQHWSAAELRRLLRVAASAVPGGPDVYDLTNQPACFAGSPNPFLALPHASSPSAAHGTTLPADPEALFAAKLSKETRKKLRKKEAKLGEMGAVRHFVATTPEEQARIAEAAVVQKSLRLRSLGIPSRFDTPEMRAFVERAAAAGAIELHALTLDKKIVATYGGGVHAGRWSGMINAFDPDEDIARTSPGDLLLLRVVASCCTRGIRNFDLGIGEARYKAALCDERIALVDVTVAMSPAGHACAALLRARRAAKRSIKRDPRLLRLALRLRRIAG